MKQRQPRSTRRVVLRFVLILLASMVVGFALGFGGAMLRYMVLPENEARLASLAYSVAQWLPVLFLCADLVVLVVSIVSFLRTKKLAAAWDGEDESVIGQVEQRLNRPLILVNVTVIVNFMFISLLVAVQPWLSVLLNTLGWISFLGTVAACIALTYRVVALEKRLNPEKQGNVLDTRFQKDWLNSCDEAERSAVYRAGYKSYRTVNLVCPILWAVCAMLQALELAGPLPGLCVLAIWLVLTVTYLRETVRSQTGANASML